MIRCSLSGSKPRLARMALPEPYYQDDSCTIYHGDCREILIHLSFGKIGVLLTDPPYGIGYHSSRSGSLPRSISGDEDTRLRDFVLAVWEDRPALVFGSWRRPAPTKTRQLLIWDTLGANGMGALDLPWKPSHQQIYVLGKGFGGRRTTDVLRFAPVQSLARNGRVHPHEKPVGLLTELLLKSPEGTVFDPFMGSGSTLRAAKDLGRKAIGIEIEERYCEIAVKRLAQEVLL